jgi:hypothetical protein
MSTDIEQVSFGPNRSVTLTDVRYVPNLVVPVQPGATIIRGPCGSGKSIALDAIGLGLGAKERARVHPCDDAERAVIDCLGVIVNVTEGRVTSRGDSDVGALEEFDVGDLIDPPVKDPAAKNRHGIKALLRLSGAAADPAAFYHLAGDQARFEAFVSPDAVKTDDLVELAGRVKAAFHARARLDEDAAEREEGKASALRNAGEGLELTAETDSAKLQAAHVAAVSRQSALETQARAAHLARDRATHAREQLVAATGQGRTIAELEAAEQSAKADYQEVRNRADELKRQWELAKVESQAAFDRVCNAEQATVAARNTAAAMSGWQQAIEAAEGVAAPADEEIAAARQQTLAAQQAIERAGVIRDARVKLSQAQTHQAEAHEHRKEATRLREAAKQTDDVLSKAVASSRFQVARDILYGIWSDNTRKPYYAASDGEWTALATAEKIERTRALSPDPERPAIVKLPQRVLQDLPDSIRQRLFAMAASMNACIISAQVDDGELRCEVWTPDGLEATA